MPFCYVAKQEPSVEGDLNDGVKIYYRTYGHGSTKVLLIIGLAATNEAWKPQVEGLTGTTDSNCDEMGGVCLNCYTDGGSGAGTGIEACTFDNRGVGKSSVPTNRAYYTTTIMANDALALLDHLGWESAHIVGHSMGAMIACKLAALVPKRILSLALLSVTGGGFECIPRIDHQMLSIAIRFFKAKSPEQRAVVDLDTHFTQEYLEEYVGPKKRRVILYQDYVKAISSNGLQCNYGFHGHINACWTHGVTKAEIESIRSTNFLVSIIHGRYDIIAQMCYATRLARKMQPVARMIDLHGGHLLTHERAEEVNKALLDLIVASKTGTKPHDWTNLPIKPSFVPGLLENWFSYSRPYFDAYSSMLGSLFMFLTSLFLLLFGYIRRATGSKTARVGSSGS